MNNGHLRLSRQGIILKNSKTGKVDSVQAGELTKDIWQQVALGHGLKLLTKNGHVYKYDRFWESDLPPTQEDSIGPVEAFTQNVLSKADIIQAAGDTICVFLELQCLTLKGPVPDVLLISLDLPIKQGQTRYHFLILLFSKDEDISLPLNMNDEEVEKHFERWLTKNMSSSLYEMVSRVTKALVNHKIMVPGNSQRHSGAQCVTCSYEASSRLLTPMEWLNPMEWGFIYVHKPPVHLCFIEITFVNFACGTTTTHSFDFEINTKQGTQYTFGSIEREEY
ncbi:FACT complex subunit SSRP1 [Heterocephalus glaber]|uniref:FACT complex subunit SSRP1 n=1 Tax=Heterocephalus glaber TaxID=10181 RepID=G5C5N8_HETGA|nr:FACT complex subunit SSRP1 [Heterocephalus glaber]